MKLSPLVSLGMPIYNGEQFLVEALDSLIGQTFTDFEIIICDNASTDRTPILCKDYVERDARIRYFRNDSNIGAAANFNKTFWMASGKYFKWCAHDDVCAPEYLERCVEILEKNTDVILAYPRTKIISEENPHGVPFKSKVDSLATESPDPVIRYEAMLNIHGCFEIFGLIRKDCLARTPLIGAYGNADGVLLAKLALLGKFKEVPEYLFLSRKHPQQSTTLASDYRRYTAWYDPKLGKKILFPYWRMHYEWFRSIAIDEVSFIKKLQCYFHLGRWIYRRKTVLFKDLVNAFSGSKDMRVQSENIP